MGLSRPLGAQILQGVDDVLLEFLQSVRVAQIDALAGSVLGEFLEMEGAFAMGKKFHGGRLTTFLVGVAEGQEGRILGEVPSHGGVGAQRKYAAVDDL